MEGFVRWAAWRRGTYYPGQMRIPWWSTIQRCPRGSSSRSLEM